MLQILGIRDVLQLQQLMAVAFKLKCLSYIMHISPAHLACVEAKQNKELYEANDAQHHPWLNVIVKMDKQLLQHMNQVILDVYNDAKIGTLHGHGLHGFIHSVLLSKSMKIQHMRDLSHTNQE